MIWLIIICLYANTAATQVMPDKIIQESAKAIVKIRMYSKTGKIRIFTGFFIDESGTCMTDLYNLENALWGSVITEDGSEYEIDRITAISRSYNAAKFTLKNTKGRKFPFLNMAADPRNGYRYATFIHSSEEKAAIYYEGIIHNRFMNRYTDHESMHISALPREREGWGVPLLNARGEVIGMVSYIEDEKDFIAEYIAPPDSWEKTDRTVIAMNEDKIVPLLRIPETEPNLIYYAIELTPETTYVYAAYTHTWIYYAKQFFLWNERDRQQFGFYIKDRNTGRMFYLKESTLGSNGKGTEVEPCMTQYFRLTFPPLPPDVQQIDLIEGSLQEWNLSQIELQANHPITMRSVAEKEHALRYYLQKIKVGKSNYYMQKFKQTFETYPAQQEMALNGQAYAMLFNGESIDDVVSMLEKYTQTAKPTNLTWLNLYRLYRWQESYDKALTAINRVIELTQGARLQEWYAERASLYEYLNDYDAAYKDWETASKVFYVASQYSPWMFTAYKMACAYEAGKAALAKTQYQELQKQLREWSEANNNAQIGAGWQEYIDQYARKMGFK